MRQILQILIFINCNFSVVIHNTQDKQYYNGSLREAFL